MATIVEPVPCSFWLLLKLETRMLPGSSGPPEGKPTGTKATPYGLTSPLDGTVDTIRSGLVGSCPKMDSASAHAGTRMAGSTRNTEIRIDRCIFPQFFDGETLLILGNMC